MSTSSTDDHPPDLCCPLSLDLLEDPITTPCCGRAFSRQPLAEHMKTNNTCPLCRARIKKNHPSFDVNETPRNKNIAAMIEHYLLTQKALKDPSGSIALPPRLVLDDDPVWHCSVKPVRVPNRAATADSSSSSSASASEELPVSIVQLNVNWPTYSGDVCMMIPVIDKSGSMGGQPFEQVKQALLHMHHLTFTNRQVFTCLILYDSAAEKIMVPRDGDLTTARAIAVEQRIKTMSASGGTNFANAFKMIQEVLLGTKDSTGNWTQGAPVTVTSAVVIFMTDGQDNTYYGKPGGNEALISQFKGNLKDWTKPLTVHTIGFSAGHDYKFLDELRKAGSIEGVFRYADPKDDGDTLCQKMSDLAGAIISNTSLQATLYTPFPVRGGFKPSELVPPTSRYHKDPLKKFKTELSFDMEDGHGKQSLFLDAKASEVKDKLSSLILEIGRRDFEFQLDFTTTGAEEQEFFEKWVTHLATDVLRRTLFLATNASTAGTQNTSTSFLLQCALLLKRARSIALFVRSDEALLNRIQMCITQLENLVRGKQVSVARISDVASTAKAAAPTTTTPAPVTTSSTATTTSAAKPAVTAPTLVPSQVLPRIEFFAVRKKRSDLHNAVTNGKYAAVEKLIEQNPALCITVDENNNSPLMYACCMGRYKIIEKLCAASSESLSLGNKHNLFPVDMAALCGKWKTLDRLLMCGARSSPNINKDILLQNVLSQHYYNTAGRLIAAGIVTLSLDVLKAKLPAATLEWVMEKMASKSDQPATADPAVSSAPSPATATAAAIPAPETKEPPQSPETIKLYLKNAVENGMTGLAKKLLAQNVVKPTMNLLFLCGPQGETGADIAELLLDAGLHVDNDDGSMSASSSSDNSSNSSSYETPLFRAAEKGWDQLLMVLIARGANVNWQNKAGNTPLWIASMNRHLEAIVELLNAGADPNLSNHRGDLPLMCVCQRNMCSGVSTLLAGGARVEQTDPAVNSPVMVCCRLGHDVILEMLLTKLAKDTDGKEKIKKQLDLYAIIDGFNPIIAAAEQNRAKCIEVLAKYGADLNCKTASDNKILPLGTPLHIAVYYGCIEAASALLVLGANPNSTDLQGRTPLHIAVLQSNAMMVRLLKSHKVDMTIRDNTGHVASFYASSADIKFEMDDPTLKYLLQLARSGSLEANLREIIKRDSSMPGVLSTSDFVDVCSGDGWSPLMESIIFGNSDLASVLTELGANPHRTDIKGLSAVFWASLLARDFQTYFKKELQLASNESACLVAIESLKKADLRNTLLFDIDPAALRQEYATEKEQEDSGYLHEAMINGGGENSSQKVEIQKTRTKCSVGAFLKTDDKSLWIGKKPVIPNRLLLSSLVSVAKYLMSKTSAPTTSTTTTTTTATTTDTTTTTAKSEFELQELTALHVISSNAEIFCSMNAGLLSGNKGWSPFISLAIRALEQLPPCVAEVYRGINGKFNPQNFVVGNTITWSAFSTCTASWYDLLSKEEGAQGTERAFKYNIMYVITPKKSARSLSEFSAYSNLSPIILLPNTTFTITALHIADVVALGQPNIRNTAYKMTDNYLSQAEKKQKPILVVLEEKVE